MKTMLSKKVWNANQSWHYQTLWQIGSKKVRIYICRNAYDNQSFERAYLFDTNQWQLLIDWPISVDGEKISYVQKTVDESQFLRAENCLVDEVILILSTQDFSDSEQKTQVRHIGPLRGPDTKFLVTWEIEIDGVNNETEAAEEAFNAMQDPDTLATVFLVKDSKGNKYEIDLGPGGQG